MKIDIDRRSFLKITATGILIGEIQRLFAAEKLRSGLPDIALITNLLNKELDNDWRRTLKRVADIGYKSIEFNKIGSAGKAELKSYLNEINLRPLAGGGPMAQFCDPIKFAALKDDTLFYNKPYLVCYWPWNDNGLNKQPEDFITLARQLNSLGESCNRQGIRFALHNHTIEFNNYNGLTGYDILMQHTDPAKVTMLLDIYWATKAGADVIQLIKNYPGRFELMHVKDMDNTAVHGYTCPGYGTIDFRTIFKLAANAGVKHYIIEVDDAPNPMNCISDSYAYVKSVM